MALPGRSLGRRLLSPVAARLDARATSRAQLAIDRYHRQTVEPLRSELERLRGQVDAAATHAVYVPALTPDQRPPAEGFMAASTCAASDFLHPRFAEIVSMLHDRPRFHRKLWEHVFIVHHLLEQGVLEDGRHGIGFGVGTEVLPAVFAAAGSRVTATDAPSEIATGAGWTASGEFAAGVESLANPGLVEPDRFRELVDYRTVDMNAIGPDLSGHDFAWSACCFEHLGSLRRGIDFVIASTERCLKPGGIGVHTTEFNLSLERRHARTSRDLVLPASRHRGVGRRADRPRSSGCRRS